MASQVPTSEQLKALPPGYMAEDIGYRLTNTAIAFLVLVHVIYISHIVSRAACAERNHWEIWTLYPLSYLSVVGLSITGVRELCFPLSVLLSFLLSVQCQAVNQQSSSPRAIACRKQH